MTRDDNSCVLAIVFKNNQLGAAYYSTIDSILYTLQDINASSELLFHLITLLKLQIQPTIILTNSRIDDELLQILKQNNTNVETRPSVEFNYDSGKSRLLSTRICNHDSDLINEDDYYYYLSSLINLESKSMVGCAGAVLQYLVRITLTGEIKTTLDDDQLPLLGINQFSLSHFQHVNIDALYSLQILNDQQHPNMHISTTTQGLSLIGILDHTKTLLGKQLLKSWLLYPSVEIDIIQNRHAAVGYLVSGDKMDLCDELHASLKNIKNIPRILSSLQRKPKLNDWQSLLKFAYNCLKIRACLLEYNVDNVILLQEILNSFNVDDLRDLGTAINDMIDFDESEAEDRFVVKAQVNLELDEFKRLYAGLDDFLSAVALEQSQELPFVESLTVIYFPQLGYLISIPLIQDMQQKRKFENAGLVLQFSTESTVYYKSNKMRELDDELGDLHSIIADMEISMMHRLCETVLAIKDNLLFMVKSCSMLDCLLSFATASKKYHYSKPTMTNENVLEIHQGRHPLQELCIDDCFIPNSTILGNKRIILLTGANSSGKSIYLKQVALIVYMAHIGCFVPAASSVIGITDKILTRIQTRESVSKSSSSFMLDLHQINQALVNATPHSLVLIDEFGKGTTSVDGIGLFCAVIESFSELAHECPKVVAATHFHEIYSRNLIKIADNIQDMTMEIIQNPKDNGVVFLYRAVNGRALQSYGIYCASIAGLPKFIVERGAEVVESLLKGNALESCETEEQERIEKSRVFLEYLNRFDFVDGDWNEMFACLKE